MVDHRKIEGIKKKKISLCFIDFDCVDHSKLCGKFLKKWEYQTTYPAFSDIWMQVKKQHLELDMKQQSGSKLGKEYVKAIYWHPIYLIYTQSTSCETPG